VAFPSVAIVGRPNVGKSSLFNWLAGKRISIVDPTAGVTRDRISALVETNNRYFELVDTGGMGNEDCDNLTDHVEGQISQAMEEADAILFLVDVRAGIMPLDTLVADKVRTLGKPVLLVANKCDHDSLDTQANEFYKFGFSKIACVSAQQKRHKDAILNWVHQELPRERKRSTPQKESFKIAIVGRRNTGKSTFINALAEEKRVIVSEVAGTTRDSVDVRIERDNQVFILIDTAGVRRKRSVKGDIEFYSMARAERSIRRADVVLLFLDARNKISRVDKQLAEYVLQFHKPAVFVVNKWDLIAPKGIETGKMAEYVRDTFPSLDYVPIAFTTAMTGRNVFPVLNLAQTLHKQAEKRFTTKEITKVIEDAFEKTPPPQRQNRNPRFFFASQVDANPPTIVLFTNGPSLFDPPYIRYLQKYIRDHLGFGDIPIRLLLRGRQGGSFLKDGELEEEEIPITLPDDAPSEALEEMEQPEEEIPQVEEPPKKPKRKRRPPKKRLWKTD